MNDRRRLAEEFASRLKAKYGERIQNVILFGSVARGDYGEESDIDVLVVTQDTSWTFRVSLAQEAIDVLMREGVYISAKPIALEDFDRTGETIFGRSVRREGLFLA
jgi:predicted nucleotidyltransferase